MSVTVRHVTASGRLDECWSLYAPDRRIDVLVRRGACPLALAIYVCSKERACVGAHRITRIDGESWAILPEHYATIMLMGRPRLVAIPKPIGGELAPGAQAVCAELEQL